MTSYPAVTYIVLVGWSAVVCSGDSTLGPCKGYCFYSCVLIVTISWMRNRKLIGYSLTIHNSEEISSYKPVTIVQENSMAAKKPCLILGCGEFGRRKLSQENEVG